MSEINKNVTISEQYYSTAKGPLDAKLTPADTYAELTDLARIPMAQRYVGLTVTVLNSGHPVEYWLVGGTSNPSWKVKAGNVVATKADLMAINSRACTVGLEMIVQVDESNDNKLTKYWVTRLEGSGSSTVAIWEKKQYEAAVPITGEDQEQ